MTLQLTIGGAAVTSSAVLGGLNREYRYELRRRWAPGQLVCWVMLNPSTADASQDDPTIRRCSSFSRAWGYGGLMVVNLFAYRATKPAELKKRLAGGGSHRLVRIVGGENHAYVTCAMREADLVVGAWGAGLKPWATERAELLRSQVVDGWVPRLSNECPPLMCLGRTKCGAPRHPLYVPAAQKLERWS
jgi:hypothetical protein